MGLLPENPRDQKLVVAAVLALGLAVAYQQLVWSPKAVELSALEGRLNTLDSLNRVAKADVSKGEGGRGGTTIEQATDASSRELGVLRYFVPVANEVPELLESISRAAQRAGLSLSDVAPDGVITGDQFDAYRYKLGVTGTYSEVAELLANIGSLRRIVAPINLALAPTLRPGEIKPNRSEQLLDARFQIQTYVAHATPAQTRVTSAIGRGPRLVREELGFSTDDRRDPFLSLLTTNELHPAMSDLRLTGVLYERSGGRSVATLRDLATNTPYRVSVGSVLGRMRVSAIHSRAVVFAVEEFGAIRRDSLVFGDSTKTRSR